MSSDGPQMGDANAEAADKEAKLERNTLKEEKKACTCLCLKLWPC